MISPPVIRAGRRVSPVQKRVPRSRSVPRTYRVRELLLDLEGLAGVPGGRHQASLQPEERGKETDAAYQSDRPGSESQLCGYR